MRSSGNAEGWHVPERSEGRVSPTNHALRYAQRRATQNDHYGQLADEAAGVEWRWTTPGPPGVYRVERQRRTVFAAAINIPVEESTLDVFRARELTDRLAEGRRAAYRGAADEDQRRDDFWKWFAVACVACVLGEISALLAFRA